MPGDKEQKQRELEAAYDYSVFTSNEKAKAQIKSETERATDYQAQKTGVDIATEQPEAEQSDQSEEAAETKEESEEKAPEIKSGPERTTQDLEKIFEEIGISFDLGEETMSPEDYAKFDSVKYAKKIEPKIAEALKGKEDQVQSWRERIEKIKDHALKGILGELGDLVSFEKQLPIQVADYVKEKYVNFASSEKFKKGDYGDIKFHIEVKDGKVVKDQWGLAKKPGENIDTIYDADQGVQEAKEAGAKTLEQTMEVAEDLEAKLGPILTALGLSSPLRNPNGSINHDSVYYKMASGEQTNWFFAMLAGMMGCKGYTEGWEVLKAMLGEDAAPILEDAQRRALEWSDKTATARAKEIDPDLFYSQWESAMKNKESLYTVAASNDANKSKALSYQGIKLTKPLSANTYLDKGNAVRFDVEGGDFVKVKGLVRVYKMTPDGKFTFMKDLTRLDATGGAATYYVVGDLGAETFIGNGVEYGFGKVESEKVTAVVESKKKKEDENASAEQKTGDDEAPDESSE